MIVKRLRLVHEIVSVCFPAKRAEFPGQKRQCVGITNALSLGSKIEIAVDGSTVQKLAADREGKLSSTVRAPSQYSTLTF
jgi:hypothetical protein